MTTQSGISGDATPRWYIVHTYSGQEDRVQKNLEQRIATMDVKDKILNVVVPTEEEVEIKEGERKTVQKKMYAGYLIVQMVMDEESVRSSKHPWCYGLYFCRRRAREATEACPARRCRSRSNHESNVVRRTSCAGWIRAW